MKLFGGGGPSGHGGKHAAEHKAAPSGGETGVFAPVDGKEKKKKKAPGGSGTSFREWARKHRAVFVVPGCIVLVLLALVMAYAIWEKPPETNEDGPLLQQTPQPIMTPIPEPSKYPVPEETPEPEPEPTPTPEPTGHRPDCYTFLIAAYDQLGANTDTLLVGKLDVKAGTLDVVNIPRDTLVNVSWGVKKVNTILAYEKNDPERLVDGLSGILGFEVDSYAVVDIQAVEKLVDCIGGVYYTVPRDMDYDDPTQNLSIHIQSGYQWLNGEDAVKVLRFRVGNDNTGYANGDLGRIATQQDFLMSIASQMLTLGNIPNLSQALTIFEDYVDTDLTVNNLAFFAREFLLLDKENIRFHTLPGEGVSIRGGSYYQVTVDDWLELVNTYINPYYEEITRENVDILTYLGSTYGAVSTTGETVSNKSFFDFSTYTG